MISFIISNSKEFNILENGNLPECAKSNLSNTRFLLSITVLMNVRGREGVNNSYYMNLKEKLGTFITKMILKFLQVLVDIH